MKKRIISILLVVCLLILPLCLYGCNDNEESEIKTKTAYPRILITLENGDELTAELYPDVAPITVENFLKYVDDGFYNGTCFHRVIEDFMMQGGGYYYDNNNNLVEKTATYDPIYGEFSSNGWSKNNISHTYGVLSMARTNAVDSATSQFFICFGSATHCDGKYATFGSIIGKNSNITLQKYDGIKTKTVNGTSDIPVEKIVIKSITRL